MSNLTFVTQEQCFGSKKLDIFEKRGTKAAITDFAIALGGYVSSGSHIDSDPSLKGRTGWYWIKSDDGDNDARAVSNTGDRYDRSVTNNDVGARPALPFSSINTIPTNGVSGKYETDVDGVKFVYNGYYPRTAPAKGIQDKLNMLSGRIEWNRKNMIPKLVEVPDIIDYDGKTIKTKWIDGYRHNGKIYVRMESKRNVQFSNGENYLVGDSVWFEVEPVKQLISETKKCLIPEEITFSGVPFSFTRDYKTENFERTPIYKFANDIYGRDVERLKSIVRGKDYSDGLETSDAQTRKN